MCALRRLLNQGETERAQLLGAYLGRYWIFTGHVKEGRAWLAQLRAMPGSMAVSARTRGRLLIAAISAAAYDGDPSDAVGLPEQGLAAAGEAGDHWCFAFGTFFHAMLVLNLDRDPARAVALVDEGIDAARKAGDPVLEAVLLGCATLVWLARGEPAAARAATERVLAIASENGVPREHARALAGLAGVSFAEGDLQGARELFEHAVAELEEIDDHYHALIILRSLVFVAVDQGDTAYARAPLRHSLESWTEMGRPPGAGLPIVEDFVYLFATRRVDELALTLASARPGKGCHSGPAGPMESC